MTTAKTSDYSIDKSQRSESYSRNLFSIIAIFFVAIIPLFSTSILPLIDFYNHVARYYVLSNINDISYLKSNYTPNWIVIPNIGLDLITIGLMKIFPVRFVAHIAIILVFLVQYGGVLYFNRALTGKWSRFVALLIVPLLYSFILNWGFANFLLGLGLSFWGAGWWVQQRKQNPNRMAVALPIACVFAVAIFFAHGVAFALHGLLLGSIEIGLFWQSKPRRPAALVGAMILLVVQAVIPVLLFLSARISAVSAGITNADDSARRLARSGQLGQRIWELIEYRITTIVRVSEGPSFLFDALTLAAMLCLIFLLLRWGRLHFVAVLWPAVVLAGLLIVAVPPTMFGIGYISDRMPLFGAFVLVAGLQPTFRGDAREKWVIGAIAGLIGLRLLAIGINWQAYREDNLAFAAVASKLPPGQLVETIVVGGGRLDTRNRRCQMYGPLMISEHYGVSRIFAGSASQPIIIHGPLLDAINSRDRPRMTQLKINLSAYDDTIAKFAESKFPWLLLCDANRLKRPLPAGLETVAAAGRFSLLRVVANQDSLD